ncbi:unnamed protein product [Symbiodinium natans]|uniref:Phytanoyl-CoA dioxygenase n=1 Tax=Symbiodinium natans TaxID=878477 RepID=A0A812UBS6_9DINO|nr:unnamed protein product [Symbiodinium natans]
MDADIPVVEIAPPRFDVDTQKHLLSEYLEEHGYAVVANVADDAELATARSLMWDFLEALPRTRVRRDDVRTWDDRYDWLPNPANGILHGFGFGQSDFMWHLRLLPRVKAAFAAIWNTNDLLVSFDGGNIFRPWKYKRSWLTSGGWFHCDQNARFADSRGKVCIQGLVTLFDATADTGGLVVIPGSHHHHEDVCKRSILAKRNGDFVPVAIDDPILSQGAVLLRAQAGDLVLWDSRTVHCNTPALETSEVPLGCDPPPEGWQPIRQVGYVCMTPRKLASDDVLQKRKEAFVNSGSTSHWPHKFVSGSAALPDTLPKDPAQISKEQRWLIGYDREASRCAVQ